MGCGCEEDNTGGKMVVEQTTEALLQEIPSNMFNEGDVVIAYVGPLTQTHNYKAPSKRTYRFGNNDPFNKFKLVGDDAGQVLETDAAFLQKKSIRSMSIFVVFTIPVEDVSEDELIVEDSPPVVESPAVEVSLDSKDEEEHDLTFSSVTDFSIKGMDTHLKGDISSEQVLEWLEEEEAQESPRSGMVSLLQSYLSEV